MSMSKRLRAEILLVGVTLVWGLTFPLFHSVIEYISPTAFAMMRFLLAALCFLPFVLRKSRKLHYSVLWLGLLLAVLNAITYTTQIVGLETITASRSAFITGLNVVIVPMIAPLFGLNRPTVIDGLSVLVCAVGLYILTGADLSHLMIGDYWTISSAFSVALGVVVIQRASLQHKDPLLTAFYQAAWVVPLLLPLGGHKLWPMLSYPIVWAVLLFAAIFATCWVFWVQMRYQRYTEAARVAIIYSLEPVFATLFAVILNHEHLRWATYLGGGLVVLSLILPVLMAYALGYWKS